MKILERDPSEKSIDELMSRFNDTKELNLYKETGNFMFTEAQINETPYHLDRLLRTIMVRNKITKEYFKEKIRVYAKFGLQLHQTKISNYKSNIMKTIKRGNISIRKFTEIVSHILGYHIRDLHVDLVHDNALKSYSIK